MAKRIVCLTLVGIMCSMLGAQENLKLVKKATIPDVLGNSLWGSTVVGPSKDNKIFLIAGLTNRSDTYNMNTYETRIWEYDIVNNSVRVLPITLPYGYFDSQAYNAAIAENGNIYLTPGNGPGGWGHHNRIIELDLVNNTALERASITANGAPIWCVTALPAPGGGVFLSGGWNGGGVSGMRHYNPANDTVTTLNPNTPAGFAYHVKGPDGRIFIFGGYCSETQAGVFNPLDNSFRIFTSRIPVPIGSWTGAWLEQSGKIAICAAQYWGWVCGPTQKISFDPISEQFEIGGYFESPGVFNAVVGSADHREAFFFNWMPSNGQLPWPIWASPEIWVLSGSNQAPTLAQIGPRSISEGWSLYIELSATDPDSNTIAYSVSNLPAGASFDPATGTFSWTPAYDQAGVYPNVLFTVTDNGNPPLQASEAITITVGNVNRSPVLAPIANQTGNEGQTLQFIVSATDPDGDPVTISASNLPDGAFFNAITNTFSWVPSYEQAGNFTVTFIAADNASPAGVTSQTMTLTISNVNRPPIMAPIGHKSVGEGQSLSFTVSATDPDGNPLTFSAGNLPAGASFDPATQVFVWTPGYDQAGNFSDVEFTVMDNGSPMEVATQLVTITVANVNRAPVFTAVGTQQVLEGQLLTFSVQANDPDGNALSYTAAVLPAGAAFDSATRQFTWRPSLAQSGNYLVDFIATDDGQPRLSGTLGVAIAIGDVPTPCEWTTRIIDTVVAQNLKKSVENSYLAHLKKVCGFVETGKITPAVNQVNSFIGKVHTDIAHGEVSSSTGDNLISMANQLLAALNH